ncbi:MAG: glycerophosphodiester phosphodiesterase [Actinomycetota bacterium]|nr:glycerophosphodiester phosphodiesterase [Actinomycetota bacterium]
MLVKLCQDGHTEDRDLVLVSHRGGKGFGSENTLESLAGALEYGVEMVETDVRMSADNVALIHHSPFLGLRLISRMEMSEIREKAPDIPTLEEYLDLAARDCGLNLEIKNCEPALLARVLYRYNTALPVLVSSFDSDFLKEFGRTGIEVEIGLISQYELADKRSVREALSCGATTLLPVSYSVRQDLMDAACEAGMRVIAWTVNSTSTLLHLLAAGVDGVITDTYRELQAFLTSKDIISVGAENAAAG